VPVRSLQDHHDRFIGDKWVLQHDVILGAAPDIYALARDVGHGPFAAMNVVIPDTHRIVSRLY
jgi:hypothetical protein